MHILLIRLTWNKILFCLSQEAEIRFNKFGPLGYEAYKRGNTEIGKLLVATPLLHSAR